MSAGATVSLGRARTAVVLIFERRHLSQKSNPRLVARKKFRDISCVVFERILIFLSLAFLASGGKNADGQAIIMRSCQCHKRSRCRSENAGAKPCPLWAPLACWRLRVARPLRHSWTRRQIRG
jgi:hypothetical protein